MFYAILVILLVLWAFGFLEGVGGGFIHILAVIAIILIILRLTTGNRFNW